MNIFLIRILNFLAKKYYSRYYKNIFIKDEKRDLFENEQKKQIIWPNDIKAVFNLQFDDFCAKSKENSFYDYGGKFNKGINVLFEDFLNQYSFLKITLFVIPSANFKNWQGIFYGKHKDENKFNLSNPQFYNLIRWLKKKEDQIEIACHGYNHFQNKIKYFLGPAEFEFLNEKESEARIEKSLEIFNKVGIYPNGFRPPCWGVGHNSNFGLISALKKLSFTYISLSSLLSGLNWDEKRVSNIYPQYYQGLLNIPQNISILWDIEKIKKTIDKIIEFNGIIILMGHYNEQNNWMSDGIGKENLEKIGEIIDYLNQNYPNQIWYAKLNEIADYWKKNYE